MSSLRAIDKELRQLARLAPAGFFVALHIRAGVPLFQDDGFPRAWTEFYNENGYALRDPLVAAGYASVPATRWSDLPVPDPAGMRDAAARFGLRYGLVTACGTLASRSMARLARADREFSDDEAARVIHIVHELHELTLPPERLTDAQAEALRLIAGGLRHAAAAARLGISESALKMRLKAARQRLLAHTTAEAIQRARDNRLL